jgi:signal transduction histidine kinase
MRRRFGPAGPVNEAPAQPGGADAATLSQEPAGMGTGTDGLSFADVPRLELDQLLGQLIDRADDVLAAQGRLRGLLRANAVVAAELSLPVVLRRIVDVARELLGARYAALGVIGRDGELEQFVHAGMGGELVARIGELPRGRGILGLLTSRPVPIRLADLADHPASAGFPPAHPPMAAFLGVPIRAGEEIFGNLYLTERLRGGEFTVDDEELAIALAAAAGGAIANARRFTESEQRRRWLSASGEVTPLLLSGEGGQPYDLITRHAAAAAEADFAVVALPAGADQVIVQSVTGPMGAELHGRTAPLKESLAGRAILTGKPFLVSDYRSDAAAAALSVEAGPLMVVPLAAGEQILGALIVGRLAARPGFADASLQMATAFASNAAVTLELARARADQITVARMEDHDRIAGDLHDHVIQELFALGMGLQGLAASTDRPAHAERINGYIDSIDKVIGNIRASIFQLQVRQQYPAGVQSRLLELLDEHVPQLGFTPQVHLTGSLDASVDTALASDILAVAREALSNCARHAAATVAEVSLAADDGLVTLDITDNGTGIGTPARSSGLTSMRRRAERNGGALQISNRASGGTQLTWTARLDRRRPE